MELQDRVINHCHQSLQLAATLVEEETDQIVAAAERLFHCLLNEHQILVCGNGPSAALAQYFSTLLLNRYRHERPGLPAFALSDASAAITGIAADSHFGEIYSRQIRALGQPGSTLIILSADGRSASLIQAVQAAHDRNMTILALLSESDEIAAVLQTEDLRIQVGTEVPAQIHEAHLLIMHCLCDLLEYQLFGGALP